MGDTEEPNTTPDVPNPDNGAPPPDAAKNTDKEAIPYERFKEVNDKYKALEKQLKDAEKARQADEQERLKKQGEYQTLAEQWEQKAKEYEPYKTQAEEANAALEALLATELANPNMPESTKELLTEMSPAKQSAHIAKHKASWAKAGPPNINAGNGSGGTSGYTDDDKQRLAAKYGVKPEFIK